MTNKDNIDWPTLLDNTSVTAQHSNASNRIAAATEILQQTAQQFVKVLNERAKLLANSAQFEAAIRDAAAIRTMLPESGLGYLCTGDVCCQQGHYAAAIAIFDQGLEAVHESDPYYQQLEQHRLAAFAYNNKRVDFITKLPFDIVVTYIVPRMIPVFFSNSSCELLYVSREWQDRLLKQPDGLSFEFDLRTDALTTQGHNPLVQFAPCIQRLEGFISDDRLDELFGRANFSKLKRLELSCDESTPRRPLLNGLALIADSLTHLTFHDCRSVQLRDILESCPNLVSLNAVGVDVIMPSSASIQFPNLTHLALSHSTKTSLTNEDMVDLLSRFPSLLRLEITPMHDSSALTLLHQHCPYLQVLCYGDSSINFHQHTQGIHPKQKGIHSAYLSGSFMYDQDHLIQFLLLNRHSLERFDFSGEMFNEEDDDDVIWEISNGWLEQRDHQQSLQLENDSTSQLGNLFPRLINFHFDEFMSSLSAPFMQWILLNAPNLKAIHLPESLFQPDIANAMVQLKHLSKLEIDYVYATGEDEDDNDTIGIRQFLENHIAMGDHSTLEHVIVHNEEDIAQVTWIPLLSQLKCLKHLELFFVPMEDDCLSILGEICQGCPALEELRLDLEDTEMPQGLLEPLRQLSVRCLRIDAASIGNADLLVLASFSRLERLYLLCDIPDDMLVLLKSRIPKVVV
ncbi:hypothetical protein LRAMOSA09003 [Lichtheimia ramosa]|uniref:F-box domain-containing protein n=1 Tax=Lichtheimia ramosa TaxID=688394 RepID=A0A077WGI9_9FUNG|nr:hypothetical protein LRAMOSA09003 [Lichtheimia ramosa]